MSDPHPLTRLKEENGVLRAEIERFRNFNPTPEQINALPEKLKDYIHLLRRIVDSGADRAALLAAEENVAALTRLVTELQEELAKQ